MNISMRLSSALLGLPSTVSQCVTAAYFKVQALRKCGFRGVHSDQKIEYHSKMNIHVLPALSDNYMYLIVDKSTHETAVVDPVAPETVVEAVKKDKLNLTTVLTTHHHWDHAGGNKQLVSMLPGLSVFGGDDRIDALTMKVTDGYKLKLGNLLITCISTPCHTSGHICYLVTEADEEQPAVFTGDTLFLGGCGRFFEGNATQMNIALNQKLSSLANSTKVYCGHEYSIQNLSFGLTVEPDNVAILNKLAWAKSVRAKNPPEPTVPSTIGEEKEINPFMRVSQPAVRAFAGKDNDEDTMTAIRGAKDKFKMN